MPIIQGMMLSGSVKPFASNILVLKTYLSPISMKMTTKDGVTHKNDFVRNNFVLSSEYKNFSIQYEINFPVYSLNGSFLQTNENSSDLFLSYKLGEWTFSTGMYWIGIPAEYKTKSLPDTLVNYSRVSRIFNNKNMFILGLSYDVSSGKKLQMQKKLNNTTAPAATF